MRKQKRRRRSRAPSERAKMERTLGHKLMKGEIPVVPPHLIRCPVPATHVKEFEGVCKDYADGKITEADVLAKVSESLRTLKKPEQPKPEGEQRNVET